MHLDADLIRWTTTDLRGPSPSFAVAAQTPPPPAETADPLAHFLTHGYATFSAVLPRGVLTQVRDILQALKDGLSGAPAFAHTPQSPAPGVEVSCTGLVFKQLLTMRPELAELILVAGPAAVMRALLGRDARLELVGGVLTDHTRPFYPWHHHVGGPDDTHLRKAGVQVAGQPGPRRLTYLLYLDGAESDDGPLHILPTQPGRPRPAGGGITDAHWPGEHVLTFPAGSVVLLDERTWHAVPQRTTPGQRRWIGMHVAAAKVPVASHQDPGLAALGLDTLDKWLCVPTLVGGSAG